MKKITRVLCLFLFTLLSIHTYSQNSNGSIDAAGDIAFVAYHDTLDGFSFVLLDDCPAGTIIAFIDDEWTGSAWAGVGEGELVWENNTGSTIAKGTIIDVTNADDNGTGIAVTHGSIYENDDVDTPNYSGFNTSANNVDEIYAVAGRRNNVSATFLAYVGRNLANALTGTGLTDGTTAHVFSGDMALGGGLSEGYYSGSTVFSGTLADAAAAINKSSAWTGGAFTFPSAVPNAFTGGTFSSCSAPTAQATSAVFGSETSSTLNLTSFTAPAGGADGYAIYINDTNTFTNPSDGDEPVADLTWNGAGQQPVYFGTSASPNITVSDLDPGTTYYFQVYSYNDCSGTETYETTGLTTNDTTGLGTLTITGLTGGDKTYDDTTAASATGTASLSGIASGHTVTLGGSPVFTFASANVGTGITINTSGYTLGGADAGKYTLTQPTLSGDITAKGLTITGLTGGDKEYDDTTAASASGTATLVGVESGDDVSLGGSPVFTYASRNVGTGITINTSGYTISGTDSGVHSKC